jgi:hypothetical protein
MEILFHRAEPLQFFIQFARDLAATSRSPIWTMKGN